MSAIPYLAVLIGCAPLLFLLTAFRDAAPFHANAHSARRYLFLLLTVAVVAGTIATALVTATNERAGFSPLASAVILYGLPFLAAAITFVHTRVHKLHDVGGLARQIKARARRRFSDTPKRTFPPTIDPVFIDDQTFAPVTYTFSRWKISVLICATLAFSDFVIYPTTALDPVDYYLLSPLLIIPICVILPYLMLRLIIPGHITIHPKHIEIATTTSPTKYIPWAIVKDFDIPSTDGITRLTITRKPDGQIISTIFLGVKGYDHTHLQQLLTQWHELYKQLQTEQNSQ